jgi:tetratricopeptide (TPR) repeat protein
MKFFLVALLAGSFLSGAMAQTAPPRSDEPQSRQSQRDPNESSSKDTRVDITPPPDDHKHEGSDPYSDVTEATDVREMKPWNPHKAAKDIEVGDFYFKDKNYRAAISRYREALEYKPKDAEATYKIAVALEKTKQYGEAAAFYRDYVKIVPDGIYVASAQKALGRLAPRLPNKSVPLSPLDQAMADGEKAMGGKDFAGAAVSFNKALEIEPTHALAIYKLALSLEGIGDANAALHRYYGYLQAAPGGRYSADAAAAIERLKKRGATISQSAQTPR